MCLMRSSPALQSTSAVLSSPIVHTETHGQPAPRPRMPGGAGLPGLRLILTAAWEEIRGCCLAQHMIFTDKRENGSGGMLGVNPLPFSSWRLQERRGQPRPRSLGSHSTVGLLVSGRSQGDGRSARAPLPPRAVHMALPDLCHNEFQIPRGMSLGTSSTWCQRGPWGCDVTNIPKERPSSPPTCRWCQDGRKMSPGREKQAESSPPEWAFFSLITELETSTYQRLKALVTLNLVVQSAHRLLSYIKSC